MIAIPLSQYIRAKLEIQIMGTTVGSVVISYDINRLHTSVKQELEDLGYNDNFKFTGGKKIYYLPNTTMWHGKKSSDQAMLDLRRVCANLGVELQKAIAVKASEFVGYQQSF